MTWAACLEFLSDLSGREVRTVTILAPHPDDEAIGASSLLTCLGQRAWVIYITDGAPLSITDAEQRRQSAGQRHAEAKQVLEFCRIPAQQSIWLGVVDQQASYQLDRLAAGIKACVKRIHPDVLITPAFEGGHPDHDATALAAAASVSGSKIVHLEMLSYHNRQGQMETDCFLPDPPSTRECKVVLTPSQRSQKARLFALYASQETVLRYFPIKEERFRVAPKYDFRKPPTVPPYYELYSWGIDGRRWRENACRFLNSYPHAQWFFQSSV